MAASVKIVWVSKIRVRAPAATAPRAAPTLNMVDRYAVATVPASDGA